MQLERKIVWQKWVNPLTGAGSDETPKLDEEEDEGYEDSVERDLKLLRDLRTPEMYKPKLGHVLASPMGLIPVNEHGDPAVVYDFWLAHTTFPITWEVQEAGSAVLGVESWDTFSPYRARIAFGKAFNSAEVKVEIQRVLGCTPKPKVSQPPVDVRRQTLERLKKKLSASWPAWAILELQDGRLQTFHGNEASVREQVEYGCPSIQPRTIITSWDQP